MILFFDSSLKESINGIKIRQQFMLVIKSRIQQKRNSIFKSVIFLLKLIIDKENWLS